MYAINGINLDNPAKKLQLMAPTQPLSELTTEIDTYDEPGIDGERVGLVRRKPVSLKFVVKYPRARREELLALFSNGLLTITEVGVSTRSLRGWCVSSAVVAHYPDADHYVEAFLVDCPVGAWRGVAETTTPLTAAAAGGNTVSLFAGISAPIQDALVRFRGGITNPELVDSSGAFVAYAGEIPAGQFVRFDASTGRAWRTTSDTWLGGVECSGLIEYGGERDVFELVPKFTDPATRSASLTLNQTTYEAGSGVQIRARSVHLI